jgi:hypothetical protein
MFADLKTVHIVQQHHCKQMGKDVIVHKLFCYTWLVPMLDQTLIPIIYFQLYI